MITSEDNQLKTITIKDTTHASDKSWGTQLFPYENIRNELFEKSSESVTIDVPKNINYFSRMKTHIVNL